MSVNDYDADINQGYRRLINTTQLRNNNIRYFWEGLKYSKLEKRIRIRLVMKYWSISQSTLEQIIYPNWDTEGIEVGNYKQTNK